MLFRNRSHITARLLNQSNWCNLFLNYTRKNPSKINFVPWGNSIKIGFPSVSRQNREWHENVALFLLVILINSSSYHSFSQFSVGDLSVTHEMISLTIRRRPVSTDLSSSACVGDDCVACGLMTTQFVATETRPAHWLPCSSNRHRRHVGMLWVLGLPSMGMFWLYTPVSTHFQLPSLSVWLEFILDLFMISKVTVCSIVSSWEIVGCEGHT